METWKSNVKTPSGSQAEGCAEVHGCFYGEVMLKLLEASAKDSGF